MLDYSGGCEFFDNPGWSGTFGYLNMLTISSVVNRSA
jgi:hypothetical protein